MGVKVLSTALDGQVKHIDVHDPFGNMIESYYGIFGNIAIVLYSLKKRKYVL